MKSVGKKKALVLSLSLSIGASALAGCGSVKSNQAAVQTDQSKKTEPFKISMLLANYTTDPAKPESSVWKKVEEYTNTKLDVTWAPAANYLDKLNVTIASGNLPMVIKADDMKVPAIANAVKAGAFWELGPYLKDYPNLSKANQTVLNNVSVNGKIYGLYRGRPLGRMAIGYRKDWLDNLGMKEPETIDDFYNMLKAFTYNDPDKDGKNDTFGMAVTKWSGPFDIMQTWFGVPNKWGLDKDGKLQPSFMFPEYMDALKFFKKLYDEKLINQDFAVYDSAKWNDLLTSGKAGSFVDVADRATQLEDLFAKADPKAKMDIIGAVSGPKGLKNLPTTGYAGLFMIPKSSVKTEADLKKILAFFDKLNDPQMQVLLEFGIDGVHYKVEDGKLVTLIKPNEMKPDNNLNDMTQFQMYYPNNLATTAFKPGTPLRAKVQEVFKANEKIIVPNPAEPFISATYTQKGAQLDNIIEDARIKFIVGKIDEAGFKAAVDLWHKSGGDDYVKDINEAYAKVQK